ncbi:MAG TPA: sigma-70 family RNA polymerase sigma factor [Candidatus Eisenbacteria bacterium]|nr:sigma-70 family RNA polymerase sigma factor [Candidatus Eisenbacteria bacterium]
MTLAAPMSHKHPKVSRPLEARSDLDGWTRRPKAAGARPKPVRMRQLELIRTLEDAELVVARHALASPLGIRHLHALAERLSIGTVDVRDVTRADPDEGDASAETIARLTAIRRLAASHTRATTGSAARLMRELVHLRLQRSQVERVIASLEGAAAEQRRLRRRVKALARTRGPALETTRKLLTRSESTAGMSLEELDHALHAIRSATRDADAARAKLVEANMRLVAAIARRFAHRGLDLPDLIQEGTIGLLRAIDRFERSRGVQFATYATWWIRQAIGRALTSQARPVRLPINVEEELQTLRRERDRLSRVAGQQPSARELASRLGVSVERVGALLAVEHDFARQLVPLDEKLEADDDRTHGDALADTQSMTPLEAALARGLAAQTERALAGLTPKERKVLRLRYGLGRCFDHTLEEIGAQLGVTRQRILQIATRAIDKLRHSSRAGALRSFYDP